MTETELFKPNHRQERRNQNRVALIEATLDTIAEKGFSGTSVSAIIERANLSRGMIHLHFGGKDSLIEEAAHHSSDAYSRVWKTHCHGPASAHRNKLRQW